MRNKNGERAQYFAFETAARINLSDSKINWEDVPALKTQLKGEVADRYFYRDENRSGKAVLPDPMLDLADKIASQLRTNHKFENLPNNEKVVLIPRIVEKVMLYLSSLPAIQENSPQFDNIGSIGREQKEKRVLADLITNIARESGVEEIAVQFYLYWKFKLIT